MIYTDKWTDDFEKSQYKRSDVMAFKALMNWMSAAKSRDVRV
jgi:hypothetical protein